jgi:hypothetical protein
VYFADGYGNRRVVVFDKNGKFLRQWDDRRRRKKWRPVSAARSPKSCTASPISNEGLVYIGDRQGDRVQVFDKLGNFKRNIWVRTGTPRLPDKRGYRVVDGILAGSRTKVFVRDEWPATSRYTSSIA